MCTAPSTRLASRRFIALAAAVATFGIAHQAHAQTAVSWVGTTGDYNNAANWSSGHTPSNAANEFLMINNGGTAQVSSNAEGAFLHLGLQPGDTGNLTVSAGTLTLGELRVGGRQTLPNLADPANPTPNGGGTGSVIQTGGIVNVTYFSGTEPPIQSMYVGDAGLASGNTANGSYAISNNAALNVGILLNDQLVIGTGPGTHGTFTQSDAATVTSAGNLYVARRGATATYAMSGGALVTGTGTASGTITSGGDLWVGNGEDNATIAGTLGSFVQTGGDVTSTLTTVVGRDRGTGSYAISAGSLTANTNLNAGVGGTGSITQSGTSIVTSKLSMTLGLNGTSQPGTGTYTLNGGNLLVGSAVTDTLAIGNGIGSVGTFTQNGGTVTDLGVFQLGRNNSAAANTYALNAGTLSAGGDAFIGGGNGSTTAPTVAGSGTFTQAAGTAVTFAANVNVGYGGVATGTPGTMNGSYTMNGGTLTLTKPAAVLAIGNGLGAVGTFTQNGGTFSGAGTGIAMEIGRNAGGGTYTLAGGQFSVDTLTFNSTANAATRRLNVSGGTFSANTVNFGTVAGSTGDRSINVSAGSATIGNISNLGANGVLNYSGGNLSIGSMTLTTGSKIISSADLTLNSTITLGTITVQVDGGTLNLAGAISSGGRNITKTGTGTLTLSGAETHTAAATFTNSAGTLNLDNAGSANLTVTANSTTNLRVSQTLASLNVANLQTATLTASTPPVTPTRTLTLPKAPNLNTTGTLDLTNNALVVTYTAANPTATLVGYLASAYNAGAWTGSGLTSANAKAHAATDRATGLGYVDTGTQVRVQYAFAGDLNLDGKVDPDDYALLDRSFAKGGLPGTAVWVNGDVNYDRTVTAADYLIVDTSFAHQSGGLTEGFLAAREAEFGAGYVAQLIAAVPEPTSLAFLGLALPLLTRRRIRRN